MNNIKKIFFITVMLAITPILFFITCEKLNLFSNIIEVDFEKWSYFAIFIGLFKFLMLCNLLKVIAFLGITTLVCSIISIILYIHNSNKIERYIRIMNVAFLLLSILDVTIFVYSLIIHNIVMMLFSVIHTVILVRLVIRFNLETKYINNPQ